MQDSPPPNATRLELLQRQLKSLQSQLGSKDGDIQDLKRRLQHSRASGGDPTSSSASPPRMTRGDVSMTSIAPMSDREKENMLQGLQEENKLLRSALQHRSDQVQTLYTQTQQLEQQLRGAQKGISAHNEQEVHLQERLELRENQLKFAQDRISLCEIELEIKKEHLALRTERVNDLESALRQHEEQMIAVMRTTRRAMHEAKLDGPARQLLLIATQQPLRRRAIDSDFRRKTMQRLCRNFYAWRIQTLTTIERPPPHSTTSPVSSHTSSSTPRLHLPDPEDNRRSSSSQHNNNNNNNHHNSKSNPHPSIFSIVLDDDDDDVVGASGNKAKSTPISRLLEADHDDKDNNGGKERHNTTKPSFTLPVVKSTEYQTSLFPLSVPPLPPPPAAASIDSFLPPERLSFTPRFDPETKLNSASTAYLQQPPTRTLLQSYPSQLIPGGTSNNREGEKTVRIGNDDRRHSSVTSGVTDAMVAPLLGEYKWTPATVAQVESRRASFSQPTSRPSIVSQQQPLFSTSLSSTNNNSGGGSGGGNIFVPALPMFSPVEKSSSSSSVAPDSRRNSQQRDRRPSVVSIESLVALQSERGIGGSERVLGRSEPEIVGNLIVGHELRVANADGVDSTFAWFKLDEQGELFELVGADQISYTPTVEDTNFFIRVRVSTIRGGRELELQTKSAIAPNPALSARVAADMRQGKSSIDVEIDKKLVTLFFTKEKLKLKSGKETIAKSNQPLIGFAALPHRTLFFLKFGNDTFTMNAATSAERDYIALLARGYFNKS